MIATRIIAHNTREEVKNVKKTLMTLSVLALSCMLTGCKSATDMTTATNHSLPYQSKLSHHGRPLILQYF